MAPYISSDAIYNGPIVRYFAKFWHFNFLLRSFSTCDGRYSSWQFFLDSGSHAMTRNKQKMIWLKKKEFGSSAALLFQVLRGVSSAVSSGDLPPLPALSCTLWPQEGGALLQCGEAACLSQSTLQGLQQESRARTFTRHAVRSHMQHSPINCKQIINDYTVIDWLEDIVHASSRLCVYSQVTLVKMRSHIVSCSKVQEQIANCPKFVPVLPTSQPIPRYDI